MALPGAGRRRGVAARTHGHIRATRAMMDAAIQTTTREVIGATWKTNIAREAGGVAAKWRQQRDASAKAIGGMATSTAQVPVVIRTTNFTTIGAQ